MLVRMHVLHTVGGKEAKPQYPQASQYFFCANTSQSKYMRPLCNSDLLCFHITSQATPSTSTCLNNPRDLPKIAPNLLGAETNQTQPCAAFLDAYMQSQMLDPYHFPAQIWHTHGLYPCIKYKINKNNNKLIIKKTGERIIEA